MRTPNIIGRLDEHQVDVHAGTELESSITVAASGMGSVTATLFRSRDGYDRGGIVLRIEAPDNEDEGCFLPYAVQTETGVEIHMAGDCEANDLIKALLAVLRVSNDC